MCDVFIMRTALYSWTGNTVHYTQQLTSLALLVWLARVLLKYALECRAHASLGCEQTKSYTSGALGQDECMNKEQNARLEP